MSVVAREAGEPPIRRARLGTALRGAVSLLLEWAVPLLTANVAWGLVVAAYLLLLVGLPILLLAAPLLALPTACLMRLAVAAVRAGVPTLGMARDELGRLWERKLGLAAVQILVMGVAWANIGLAGQIGGWIGLLSGGVAIYGVIASAILATALWPIVCDPLREGPMRAQLRLAIAASVRRPIRIGLLAAVVGAAAFISVQLLVPAFVLPIAVLLAAAGYVVPLADEILPPAGTRQGA